MHDRPKVFISHSSHDKRLAREVAEIVERSGGDAWLDRKELAAGERWGDEILKQLQSAHYVVLVLTPNFLQSKWTNFELGAAIGRTFSGEGKIIPLVAGDVDTAELPWPLRNIVSVRLDETNEEEVQKAFERVFTSKNQGA